MKDRWQSMTQRSNWADVFQGSGLEWLVCRVQGAPVSFGLGVVVILCVAVWLWQRKNKLPPGPSGFKLLGAIVWSGGDLSRAGVQLSPTYGDVISFHIGTKLFVVINGFKKIRETFFKRSHEFAARPRFSFPAIFSYEDEILFTEYNSEWRENRKFFQRVMRKFALEASPAEEKIESEVHNAIELLKEHTNEAYDPKRLIERAHTAVFTSVVYSSQFKHDDPALDKILDLAIAINETINAKNTPLLEMLPTWLSRLVYYREISAMSRELEKCRDFVRNELGKHLRDLDPENPRDITDVYILKNMNNPNYIERLVDTMLMIFPDSIENTSNAVRFTLLYIIHFPAIQQRLHAELDRVVGKSQRPTLEHKKDLPYLEAVVLETFRFSDFSTITLPHSAVHGTTLDGFLIPKNAWIVGNIYSVHRDPELFPNPERFDPGRFLDERGQLTNTEHCIPFSVGRRSCPGEQLARTLIFLMLANMLHAFRFSFPASKSCPSLEKGKMSMFFGCPDPFQVILEERD